MLAPGNNTNNSISGRSNARRFYLSNRRLLGYLMLLAIFLGIAISTLIPPSSALTNNGSITTLGTALTENFNTLTAGGTWTDNTTIAGWYAQFGTSTTNPA